MPTYKPPLEDTWNDDDVNDTAPNAGKIALGWEVDEQPSSSTFNWAMKYLFKVAKYLLDGDLVDNVSIVGTDAVADFTLDIVSGTGGYGISVLADDGIGIVAVGTQGAYAAARQAGQMGITGQGKTSGPGVLGLGDTTGVGVQGTGGSTSGAGGVFTAAAGNSNGVTTTGHGTNPGIAATGGATSGTGGIFTGGATGGGGVFCTGTGAGIAVYATTTSGSAIFAQSDTGYCLELFPDSTSPVKAPIRCRPQDANPSGDCLVGDMYVTTAGVLKICTTAGTGGSAAWTSVGAQS